MNGLLADNHVSTVSRYLRTSLSEAFAERERDNLVSELFSHYLGWSRSDIILRSNETLGESDLLRLHKAMKRLREGEPLQYITGVAWFRGKSYSVNSNVLIPRPETEELVGHVLTDTTHQTHHILEIGTGSGCIAISLALESPLSSITALDISQEALEVAQQNALALSAPVAFIQRDILQETITGNWDIIVSNPPYIPMEEASTMHTNVKDHEPHQALFVPDHNPLLFYHRIAEILLQQDNPKAIAWCEIHPRFADSLSALCHSLGLTCSLIEDSQRTLRFIRIQRPKL